MPNLYEDKLKDSVKTRAKARLIGDIGPEILAILANPKTI